MPSLFLTPRELVARWGNTIKTETLGRWRMLGTGPAYTKAGTNVMYSLADVEKYEAAQRQGGAK